MKVKEILERENAVSRDRKTAILIEEGGWLHAYEWSAYLLYHLIDNETDRLNPSRRACNLSKDGIIMVGFKMGSVEKYLGNKTLSRIRKKLNLCIYNKEITNIGNSINSYLGMFKHCASYNLRKEIFGNNKFLRKHGFYNDDFLKYNLYNKL